MNRRMVSAVLALGWMALIFYLSGIPNPELPQGPGGTDKLIHMLVFGLLATLYLGAMQPANGGRFSIGQLATAALLATLYGAVDEWHQSFVPTRSADPWDLAADAIGALLAVTIVAIVSARKPHGTWENQRSRMGKGA